MRAQAQEGCPVKRNSMRRLIGGVILFVVVIGRPTVYAQAPAAEPVVRPAAAIDASPVDQADAVQILVGRSTIVNVGRPIARVSLTSADVADAHVTAPSQLLINGKAPGTISMFVWDRGGAIKRYEVTVQRDLSRLNEQLKQLFPGEPMEVRANGKSAVLSGAVSNKDIIEKAGNLTASFLDSKEELINLLQIRDGAPSNQVLLRVRFAEVSRSAMTDLGVSLAANGYKDGRWFGRSTTQQFPAPAWDEDGKFIFSDFLNLFLFDTKNQLAAVIKALQTRGLFQSLAEPNLVAESGKEASFLAGGEFPIPIAQASTAGTSITVQFKEFGVRLNFTPTVNGDRVHLKVRPEVSTLDFNNAIQLNGFRIPALTTRRTETELELQNGQTFAIAGLINNNMLSSVQKVPGLGHIPILGLLFQSKAAQKQQTELVVMITPEILPNNSTGVTTDLPRQQEPYLPPLTDRQTVPTPPPAFRTSSAATPTTAPVVEAATPSAPAANATPSPAAAAATLTATSPANRDVVQAPASAAGTQATAQELQDPRASQEERRRQQALERARAEEARRQAKQAEEDRRRAKVEEERQAKLAREQAAREAEAARKQAEIDRKRQQAEAEAERRLKEAQAAYEAELARIQRAK